MIRQIGQAKGEALGVSPYSAMIDANDPGVSEATIDPIFAELAATLPGLIGEVRERQARWPDPIPFPAVPADRQEALSYRLAEIVGHRRDHFRIDQAPHPFSVPHAPGDVRFTTRYDEDNPRMSIWATLHEAGHSRSATRVQPAQEPGLLQPARPGARGQRAREPVALARAPGRARAGVPGLPRAADGRGIRRRSGPLVGGQCAQCDPPHGRRAASRSWRPTRSRYPLHVILRHRLEQALMKGELKVADIPGAWNELFHKLLGLHAAERMAWKLPARISTGRQGCSAISPTTPWARCWPPSCSSKARVEDPEMVPALGRGDFSPYFAWARAKVHERASLADFNTLVVEATGKPLAPDALLRHLRARYLEEPAPGAG